MVNVSFSPYQQKIINVLDHQALFSFLAKVQDIILNIDILCKCRLVLKLRDIYRYLLNIVIIIASAVLLSPARAPSSEHPEDLAVDAPRPAPGVVPGLPRPHLRRGGAARPARPAHQPLQQPQHLVWGEIPCCYSVNYTIIKTQTHLPGWLHPPAAVAGWWLACAPMAPGPPPPLAPGSCRPEASRTGGRPRAGPRPC